MSLPPVRRRSGVVLTAIAKLRPAIDAGNPAAFAPGLVVTAVAVVHLSNDPMLPDELLPKWWRGPELRDALDELDLLSRAALTARTGT